jgi:anaerobic magnesium-protoporphyrin IX monomethyl ester cyclase
MRVLFTHSYFLRFDVKQLNTATPYPPLAPLYAASLLRKKGFEVALADLQFSQNPKEISKYIEDFKADVLVIYDDGFNYLTKMCLTNMREAAFAMQRIAKQFDIPVIVSSSDATDHIEKYFTNGADYIIIGEAEQTLLELLNQLQKSNDVSKISGLAYRSNDQITKNPARTVLKELDELPIPAWDLLDIGPYKKIWKNNHGYFSLNLVTTRGCPYKCNWCAKPIYGNRYNSHSPAYVVDQIKILQTKFEMDHIWFADDIFGLKPGWLKEFSERLKKENIRIKYKIQSRADLLCEEDTIAFLAASGCDTVWMGAESGSQKILDAMDKGITVDEIKKATQLLKQHKIKPALFIQFGYPGETLDDIRLTIDMINELLPHDIGISVSYPLPGTKFYENVKDQLKEKSNWKDSDDLHLMFRNTFSPEFYKHLHRYVHALYRSKQSAHLLKHLDFTNVKRIAALPYYKFSSLKEKQVLKNLEPDAATSI